MESLVVTILSTIILYGCFLLWKNNEGKKAQGKVYYNFFVVFLLFLSSTMLSEIIISPIVKNTNDSNVYVLLFLLTFIFMFIFMAVYKKLQENKIKNRKK